MFEEKLLKCFSRLLGLSQKQNSGLHFDRFSKVDQYHTNKVSENIFKLTTEKTLEESNFKGRLFEEMYLPELGRGI